MFLLSRGYGFYVSVFFFKNLFSWGQKSKQYDVCSSESSYMHFMVLREENIICRSVSNTFSASCLETSGLETRKKGKGMGVSILVQDSPLTMNVIQGVFLYHIEKMSCSAEGRLPMKNAS